MMSHLKYYFQLARLHQPAGFMLLFWPCAFGIILSGPISSIDYYLLLLFFLGAVTMRGAGCILNDIMDREIDAKVARTKDRPLASGKIKLYEAFILLFVMLCCGLFVFTQLNYLAKLFSLGAFGLAVIYPFMKRIFNYPQVFLGFTFNSGVLIAQAASTIQITSASVALYVACIFWTIGYDTIYGHQDKIDDVKTGVRSTAISFGKNSRVIIWSCFSLTYFIISSVAGFVGSENSYLYCAPAILHLLYITKKVNLDDPADCMKKFKNIAFISGLLFFVGLYLSILFM